MDLVGKLWALPAKLQLSLVSIRPIADSKLGWARQQPMSAYVWTESGVNWVELSCRTHGCAQELDEMWDGYSTWWYMQKPRLEEGLLGVI